MNNTEKIKNIVFFGFAYGLTILMAIPMYIGFKNGNDLSTFPYAQMLYPACGVMAGKLIVSRKENKKLPVAAFILTFVLTGIMMILSLMSIIVPLDKINLSGMEMDIWNTVAQFMLLPLSLAIFILFCVCSKEKKDNAGILRKNIRYGILIVLLFILLYFARIFLSFGLEEIMDHTGAEHMKEWLSDMVQMQTLIGLVSVIFSYVLSFIMFFGEEYGWRYYLQPRMQQKFGLKRGVILLGIIWGLWHFPLDFMYYTTTSGPQLLVNQIIICIAYSIFFGYAYSKTENIWVPVAIHYLNNNLVPVIEADYSADVLQNTEMSWSEIPVAAVLMIFYFLFIFSDVYRTGKKSS